jgi:small subunit ribosomal protein S13
MSQEFRHILRIAGSDVAGTLKTVYALTKIKGVNTSLSNAILRKANINPDLRVGFLTESDVEKIEEIIKDPTRYNIPIWLYNRRKATETGKDTHLTSAELVLKTKTDIDQEKEIKSWRGYRHAYSLKVRGQHTKTTGRAGKALGVKKKTLMQRPGAAQTGGGK